MNNYMKPILSALKHWTRKEMDIALEPVESVVHDKADVKYVDSVVSEGVGGRVPVPAAAEVGQTIVVTAVDENGVPTEWECVDVEKVIHGRVLAKVEFTEEVTGVTITDIDANVTEITLAWNASTGGTAPTLTVNNHVWKMYTGAWGGQARVFIKIDKENEIAYMKYYATNTATVSKSFEWGKDEILNSVSIDLLGFTTGKVFYVYEGLLALLTTQDDALGGNKWLP